MQILSKQDIEKLKESVDKIADEVSKLSNRPQHVILSNSEFCERLGISNKTAQKWRDEGIIRFSQIQRCIYYRLSDVLDMLDRFSKPGYN